MYDKGQKDHHEDAPIMQEKSQKSHHEDAPPPTTISLPPLYKKRKRQEESTKNYNAETSHTQAQALGHEQHLPPKYCSSVIYSK